MLLQVAAPACMHRRLQRVSCGCPGRRRAGQAGACGRQLRSGRQLADGGRRLTAGRWLDLQSYANWCHLQIAKEIRVAAAVDAANDCDDAAADGCCCFSLYAAECGKLSEQLRPSCGSPGLMEAVWCDFACSAGDTIPALQSRASQHHAETGSEFAPAACYCQLLQLLQMTGATPDALLVVPGAQLHKVRAATAAAAPAAPPALPPTSAAAAPLAAAGREQCAGAARNRRLQRLHLGRPWLSRAPRGSRSRRRRMAARQAPASAEGCRQHL